MPNVEGRDNSEKNAYYDLVYPMYQYGFSVSEVYGAVFLSCIFSDKAHFYMTEKVNKQNLRYWSQENPHSYDPSTQQGSAHYVVWHLEGLYQCSVFFRRKCEWRKLPGNAGDRLMPTLDIIGEHSASFMQDGASLHYATRVQD
ncbi:hypothetical protein ANN_16049 [Periplaneta americana]|uniref:Uncharacterized protein n=1 Tax=Periplaneta americana TaxID=6978 RepID=A0ABQ8SHW3_PERAM|nr:hypothetical protein ANN_16049 [Periplaneta americana]